MYRPENILSLSFLFSLAWSTLVVTGINQSGSQCVKKTKVSEGEPPGRTIFEFPRRPNVIYSFNKDLFSSPARSIFQISPQGVVSNLVTLDREDQRGNRFTLTVLRKQSKLRSNGNSDTEWTTTACSLTIDILDRNDNDPKFGKDLYVGTVREDSKEGTTVQGLQGIYATDPDQGNYTVDSYKILPGNGADKFDAVAENIGGIKFLSIRTRKVLNREDVSFYVLTVQAVDGGNPKRRTGNTQIRINVLDVNDCLPSFKPAEYSMSVLSSTPVTTSVLKVHAQDEDLDRNGEVYYFFKTTRQNFFTINPHNGVIRVARTLDLSSGNSFNLLVVAKDRGSQPKQKQTVVKVYIVKSNRALPSAESSPRARFAKRSYLVRVREDLPVNSHILHANTMHLARSRFAPVFTVLSDKPIPFKVDVNSGFLYLVKSLDFEAKRVYEFRLKVKVGSANIKDEVNVTVQVDDVDENLHAPVFKRANLEINLKRSSKSSELIQELKASDEDRGVSALVKYYIRGGNGAGRFIVDKNLGKVYSKAGISWAGIRQLELLVEARDCARLWKSSMVFLIINVVGREDCSPVFARSVYNATLRENQARGTFVVVANAEDCEKGSKVIYSISAGDLKRRFEIDQETGIVRTRKTLDREDQQEYILEITAKRRMISKAQVFIRIEDVNDNNPVFASTSYKIGITENRGRVNNLLCLLARDKDEGANGQVTYGIIEGNDKNLFTVNANTGTLSSDSLNFEDQREHTLIIRATDHGVHPRSTNTTVKISVTDVNDPPKFTAEDITVEFLEEKPHRSTVKVLPVSDEDAGQNGEFVCSYENIDAEEFGKFQVKTTAKGCEVQNMVILDWYGKNVYSLRVRVTDKASPSLRKSDVIRVTIKIKDINNHAPVFSQKSYWASTPEDTPLSTSTILNVNATDKDSGLNAKINYTMATQTNIFAINAKDGSITAIRKLQVTKYELLIYAEDKGSPKRRTAVTCYISVYPRRVIFPPRITGLSNRKLAEDVNVNTVVTRVRLRGARSRINYYIVGGNIGDAFNILDDTIRVARELDYERVKEYKLVVRAVYKPSKKLELAIEVPLKVRVQDVNDNKPSFRIRNHPLVINVHKTITRGMLITQVLAFDADSRANGRVTYDFKQRSDPIYFSIHPISGKIVATKPLDSRAAPYTFTVVAEDQGSPAKRTEYEVQVKVHKDSKPLELAPDQRDGSVSEGPLGINTKILTFNVNHGGENDLVYSIVKGNFDDSFCVDIRGSLYSAKELDRERRENYTLELAVDDGESETFTADLKITVNDVNDNLPQFSTEPIRVFTKENGKAQGIGTIQAKDNDSGKNAKVSYDIVSTSTQSYSNIFSVDSDLGTLIIKASLDHELAPEHVLTIAAQDHGTPSYKTLSRVIITVEDENDNSPRFLSHSFAERVPINAPHDYPVLRTLATDMDSGLNGEIRYAIQSTLVVFTIDESTGWIRVDSGLSPGTFSFNVTATDKGTSERSDTASVTITVEVGEGPPRFYHAGLPRGLHAAVRENQTIGSEVLTVNAMSRDLVTYAIYDAENNDFQIDPISGKISLARSLDFEQKQYYNFTVSATDRNDHMSLAHVSISILNVNDNRPRITNKNKNEISCRINRHAAIGSRLIQIRARDDDKYDRLRFSLSENFNQSHFSVDSAGIIRTKAFLSDIDYKLYVGVTVKDSGIPPLEDAVTVNVVLLNYDYNMQSSVRAEVNEGTRPGTPLTLSRKISPRHKQPRFSIVYPDGAPFKIDRTTGDLILKESLDYEVQKHYSLTVRMEESNNPKDYVDVDVEIAVNDENDNRPEFETTGDSKIHTSAIDQNPQQGTLIYQFKVTDKDTGSNGEVVFQMGDEYPGLFQLVAKTGELKTTGVPLEAKQYNVSVEAYDKGTPPLSTRTFIIVNVRYLKPEFTREEYQFEINETVAVGYQVGVVEAKSFGVLLTYQLKKKDTKFTINSMDGVLTLTSPVDYEKSDQRVFELAVVAKADETSRARVIVRVRDVNDCAPKFYRLTYVDHVPESAPIGTTVLRLHARDDDSGLNAEVRYSLDSDDFIIDSYTGVVTTAVTLDYETTPLYRINVMAHDRGIPRLNGTTRLIVNITNVNDNAPMFTSHEYSCSLWENAKRGGLVTTVKVTDADKNTITYDISAGNNAGTFVINAVSGVIKLSNEQSVHVVGPFYLLNVSASDGVHRGDAVVRVTIRDINDHAPIFTKCDQYSPAIPEGSPLGTSVLQVSASDLDLGPNGQVEYSIVHAHDIKVFQIDRKTGLIETAAMFDRESRRKYPIRVKAIDGSSDVKPEERLEGSCFIEVTITDVNDNRPIFSSRYYSENIKESVGIGHHVLQVKALDNDEGENAVVSYVMKTTTSLFKIDKQTGLITTQADLMNKKKKHHLTILARDHGVRPLTSEVDVIVDVIDCDNDPPQFQQSFYDANVPEDSKLRSTVGDRIVATSKNPKHNVFYSITPGNVPATNNPRKFNIGPNDGVVFVVGHLDREITPNYTLTIQAKNNANPPLSSSTILRIFLTDVNDCAPEFPSLPNGGYVGEIPENSDPGTSVLVVKAIDKDSGLYNKTVYSMDVPNKFFSIDSETGRIWSEKKFDREKKSSYTFIVKATDKGEPAWYSKVTVRVVVTDRNDLSPKFSQGRYNAKIHENVPIGTEVKTVSASDGDLGLNARITFDIKSGNEDDKFRILPDGRVLVNDNIDFEEKRKYELVLRAWDGKHEDTATMTIRIENENDNNPIFNTKNGIQEAFVLENSVKGTTVTNLTATDRDLDPDEWKKRIKYHLSSQVTQIFRVNPNTGAVTTLVALDRETKATYKFQAYTDDGDGRTGSVQVVVHVVDVNDNAPEFLKTSRAGAVRENMLPGTFVKKIEAHDKDDAKQGGNAVVRYAIHSDPFNAFTIDASTARLKTKVTLDRENKSTYTLIVNATDGGIPPLTSRVKVVIQVLDVNDHTPKFIKNVFQKTILEDAVVGSSVLNLTASDDDIGVNARLRFFVLKDSLEEAFTAVPDTGEILVAKQLDYEDKKSYEFEVKVEDGGFPPKSGTAKVIVNLQDSNDHSPYFDPKSYARILPEGNYKNKNLLTLIAGDNDSTMKNRQLRFAIVDGDPGNNFVVDPKTGVMRVRSSLDHETNPIHVLTVRATNTAPPYLYGEGKVTITVTDINDNAPELTNSSKKQEIFENDEGYREIGKLHATDRDLDPNGPPFTFGILRGNENNLFQLNKKRTGELTTSATFDREKKSVYSLEVWIRDSGTPPLTNNVTVKVHVRDRNDNQHKEGLLDLTVNLFAQQTISPNIPVGKVFVVDPDTDDLRLYEMVTGDFNIFTINRYTGEIYMKQRPASRKYTFRVDVSDRDSKFHSVQCKVRIKVNTIPTEAFVRSVALRFQNKTPEAFIRSFEKYKRTIAKAINTRPENVDLFSVQNAGGGSKAVDVRFGAHGSPYYAPERMIALLKKNRNRVTAHDPAVVIGYDACASEPCKAGGCKSEVKLTGGIEAVDDGNGKSFASIITRTKVTCGKCEDLFRPKTTCNSRPCLNNGTCAETPNAFLCTCPKQYRGPRCELTTRSFQTGEWVWLRALRSCRFGNVSLEFSTLQENGLLLYNGPMSELGTGDNYDFIAMQLAEGKVRVSLSLGEHRSTTLVISKSDKLNDGKWHSVEVFYNATFVRVVLDQCRSSLVKTSQTRDTEDRSNCEKSVIIRSTEFNLLTINEPLQIGGMSSQPPEYTNVRMMSYDGCIRNVKENGNMYDLKSVSNAKGSREGCPMIDQHCHPKSPCYGAAECVPSRNRFSCICPPGYGGRLCDAKSADQAFGPRGFINYRLTKSFLKGYNPKLTKVEMMIRTRDEDGGLLMSIVDKEGLERLTLRITVNERTKLSLEGIVNLGAGEHVVQLKNTFLGDGQWHHVAITRNRNEVHLGIDLNTNPRTASGKSDGRFMLLNIDEDSDIFVGSLGHRGSIEDDFDGCIKDIRINGQTVGHNESNDVAKVIKSEGVTKGCESTKCQTTQCPALYFCYDEWKKSVCLRRPCNNRPCKNGADCIDHAPNGVPMFKCLCRPGFNGTKCDEGASVIMLTGDAETINLKLVIGLSCFVFMLALATLLIICYHRYQTKGKAKFDTKEKPKKTKKKGKNSNKKDLVVIERVETDNGPKRNTLVTKNYPSMYSKDPLIHTCKSSQCPTIPPRSDSLETKETERHHSPQLPLWDIPPMIDVVISPDSDDSSPIYEDFIPEEEEEPRTREEMEPQGQRYLSGKYTNGKPSAQQSSGFFTAGLDWNIGEYGRKFYTMTRSIWGKDNDTRPSSGVSTTSNSSSVVTVVENPLA